MEYWLWLNTINGLGPVMGKRLLDKFSNPKAIYYATKEELIEVDGIGNAIADKIISSRSLDKAYPILNDCEKKDIKMLTYNDSLYPQSVKGYIDAPILLYYRGTIRPDSEGVAIVGSRRCSNYGKEIAIKAAKYLAEENIPVVSGMAKGIDSYAHISCIKNGGYTLAFLGCGVDICYPSEHRELMDGIVEKGAVISEYLPGTKPRTEYFPKRNRLISSWCKKLLVVEASEKSGALITADYAKSQGKEIYVPPHEIYSDSGKGSNDLLLQGARIFLDPSQLLVKKDNGMSSKEVMRNENNSIEKNLKRKSKIETKFLNLPPLEEKIIACISTEAKSIETISFETDIHQVVLIEYLSQMELEGKIRVFTGGRYGV